MNLLTYLLRRSLLQKLPPLPRGYSVEYEPSRMSKAESDLMCLSYIRCPANISTLERKHKATASTLAQKLPRRKKRIHPARRAAALLRRIFGLLPYDPSRAYTARYHMRRPRF
ncbi:MAG: hypothetical protein L6Q98_24605 [Anaerolineae bacterium]|nr:hypothetical protein [Anaerolineae bacterium]NUQ07160.1 hypothetical protein [Anaerolineae bacterium]